MGEKILTKESICEFCGAIISPRILVCKCCGNARNVSDEEFNKIKTELQEDIQKSINEIDNLLEIVEKQKRENERWKTGKAIVGVAFCVIGVILLAVSYLI